jgi:hypothetical protein
MHKLSFKIQGFLILKTVAHVIIYHNKYTVGVPKFKNFLYAILGWPENSRSGTITCRNAAKFLLLYDAQS